MIIAAPLLIPFATAVGLPIAGLGAIEIGKKVQDFVDNNPEVSMEILTSLKDSLLMTAPGGQGLNALFKKKAKEDSDDESVEVAPEDRTKEERAKEMKKRFKEGKGDKREIGKKGFEEVIKPVKDIEDLLEGEERYDGSLEDAPKPKFDYKKFFRNRNADGGAIGIEVLFEEKKDGGRIGFANGGENIIGADLKDEGKGVLGKADTRFNPIDLVPGLGQHIQDLEGIKQTTRGPEYFRESTNNMIQNLSDAYGRAPVVGGINRALIETTAPVGSLAAGLLYDPYSAYDRMEPGSGFKGYLDALGKENMETSLPNRFVGAAQPLANRIQSGNFPLSLTNVMDMGRNVLDMGKMATGAIGDFFFTPAGAADFQGGEMLQTPGVMVDANEGFRTPTRTNVQGRDLEADLGTRINPDIQPSLNMFQRAGNFIGELDLEDYLPFVGEKSLTRMLGQGVGNLFRGIAPARYGTSQRVYNALSPQGRSAVGNIYGPGGIMKGYNPVSAFGRGAIGAINNRISNIQNRRAPQTYASQQKIKDLFEARNKIAGTSMEGRTYTGFGKTGMGRDTDVQMSGKAPSRGRDRDVQMSGSSSGGGGGGKIVCTMMNESYGFGNFRNKIWLKHSRDLPKEYEIGYHTIFLPLVKFAKGEGKLNKVVKKTLEHIARHRTIDLKKEMKGKIHTLGRVYRKILEPICLMVGKIKKAVK